MESDSHISAIHADQAPEAIITVLSLKHRCYPCKECDGNPNLIASSEVIDMDMIHKAFIPGLVRKILLAC